MDYTLTHTPRHYIDTKLGYVKKKSQFIEHQSTTTYGAVFKQPLLRVANPCCPFFR